VDSLNRFVPNSNGNCPPWTLESRLLEVPISFSFGRPAMRCFAKLKSYEILRQKRLMAARMSSADFVHLKGFGSALTAPR
jgi:hypothetical protein